MHCKKHILENVLLQTHGNTHKNISEGLISTTKQCTPFSRFASLPHPTTGHRHSWRSQFCPPHPQHLSLPSRQSRRKRSDPGIQCTELWSAPEKNRKKLWKCCLRDYTCMKKIPIPFLLWFALWHSCNWQVKLWMALSKDSAPFVTAWTLPQTH